MDQRPAGWDRISTSGILGAEPAGHGCCSALDGRAIVRGNAADHRGPSAGTKPAGLQAEMVAVLKQKRDRETSLFGGGTNRTLATQLPELGIMTSGLD